MNEFPGLTNVQRFTHPSSKYPFGCSYEIVFSDGSIGNGAAKAFAAFETDGECEKYLLAMSYAARLKQARSDARYWEQTAKEALRRLSRKRGRKKGE